MSTSTLKACKSKDIDGKKKKKKMANVENVGESKVDKKVTEPNRSLKEENDLQTTEVDATNHKKKKQKKHKLVTESIDGDEKKSHTKLALPEENTKDKKKKKNKKTTDAISENNASDIDEVNTNEKKPKKETKEKKKKKDKTTTGPLTEDNAVECAEGSTREKKKKKETKEKKNTTTADSLIGNIDSVGAEANTSEKKTKKKKENKEKKSVEPSDIGAGNNQMSKKRKRSVENEVHHAEETTVKDSKRRKSEGLVVDAEQSVANGDITQNDPLKLSKNGPEKSGQKQQRNDSAEPKTVNAFQRVKIDEVEFVDDRLQDNSYWAKHGSEKGYGAKAQEILGQVKGRDFRHEKTKKKRGSYRGGQIDLDSHSIKFNYSDEE